MFKSWRLGRLFGFPVEINLSFLILLALVFIWFGGLAGVFVVCLAFGSVLLHELGHALVARTLGVHVGGIELGFLGGAAKMENLPRNANHEIMIAAAGPAVSLMLGGAGLGLGALFGSEIISLVGWINLVIAGFNLIPALPMDGGRILRATLSKRLGFIRATDVSVTVARVVAIAFAALGLFAGMFQLLILAPFLWLMSTREKLLARMVEHYHGGFGGGSRVDVLDHDPFARRDAGWGSPFDPRMRGPFGGPMRRFTIRHRNGRLVIEAVD